MTSFNLVIQKKNYYYYWEKKWKKEHRMLKRTGVFFYLWKQQRTKNDDDDDASLSIDVDAAAAAGTQYHLRLSFISSVCLFVVNQNKSTNAFVLCWCEWKLDKKIVCEWCREPYTYIQKKIQRLKIRYYNRSVKNC